MNMQADRSVRKQIEQYEYEVLVYKKELEACYQTISQLRKKIRSMDEQIEQLKSRTNRVNQHDHRFIHELFHLCLQNPPSSSSSQFQSSSHQHMKAHIQQIFYHLIKSSPKLNRLIYKCKCSNSSNPEHYPTYEFCLEIFKIYQNLFHLNCFKQIPGSLTDFYQKYAELKNFSRSICDIIGIDSQNTQLILERLEQLVENSKFDKLNDFKRLAKVKDMHEALTKIQSYDNVVPTYQHFIDQIIDLLEVSKSEQIIPAIKTLKLLAHYDMKMNST